MQPPIGLHIVVLDVWVFAVVLANVEIEENHAATRAALRKHEAMHCIR